MRQRVLSSLIGLVVLAAALFLFETILFNLIIAAINVIAVMEILACMRCPRRSWLFVLCIAMSALFPFVQESAVRVFMPQIGFVLIVLFFIVLLREHQTLRVENASMMFFFALFVPLFFSCAVYIRNMFGFAVGSFYLLWALGSAWLCDTGAYFVGSYLGRHLMSPFISPKKTWEGTVGGLIFATGFMPLLAFLFSHVMKTWFTPVQINYLQLILLTPVFAVAGMLGDLTASLVKRQFGVKDYGNIMPGHGGIMDRFDSTLFTLPSVFIVAHYVHVATIILPSLQ